MQVRVKLVGAFRIGRFKEKSLEFDQGVTVQDVVDSLQLPVKILGIALVNGVHAEFSDFLSEGDRLTLMPVLDGG